MLWDSPARSPGFSQIFWMYVRLLCETDELLHAFLLFVPLLLLLCVVTKAPLVDSFEHIFYSRADVRDPPTPEPTGVKQPDRLAVWPCWGGVTLAEPLNSHLASSQAEFSTLHPRVCFQS